MTLPADELEILRRARMYGCYVSLRDAPDRTAVCNLCERLLLWAAWNIDQDWHCVITDRGRDWLEAKP